MMTKMKTVLISCFVGCIICPTIWANSSSVINEFAGNMRIPFTFNAAQAGSITQLAWAAYNGGVCGGGAIESQTIATGTFNYGGAGAQTLFITTQGATYLGIVCNVFGNSTFSFTFAPAASSSTTNGECSTSSGCASFVCSPGFLTSIGASNIQLNC